MTGMREFSRSSCVAWVVFVALACGIVACGRTESGPKGVDRKPVVGFSQCTTSEPWRALFNEELEREAAKHKDQFDLAVSDGQDKLEKQVIDVEAFIRQKVDVILISPKDSAGLTPSIERAMDAGIPVIVLDRDSNTDKKTAFIGGDNLAIGREAGKFVVEHLGGVGKAKGNIVEIWGGMAVIAAQERHKGFREFVDKEPGIKVLLDNQDADWKLDKAKSVMETALRQFDAIDLVYAHNDPMAYGAYLAAKEAGRAEKIAFVGIDAIPKEGGLWVKNGFLTATFVYTTPGPEAIREASEVLKGQPVPKRTTLPTKAITKANVDEFLKAAGVK